MERYNLPSGGIEAVINEEQAKTKETIAVTASPNTPSERQHRLPKAQKIRPFRYLAIRSVALVGIFAIVGNIPVHSKIMEQQDDAEYLTLDELQEDNQAHLIASSGHTNTQELTLPVANAIKTYAGHGIEPLPSARDGQWEFHEITRGETLADILEPLKVKTTAEELMADQAIKDELTRLKTGKKILVQINGEKIEQLIYATGKRKAYIISAQNDKYTGKWDNELFEEQHNRIAFTIRNPYHYDASKAGLPKSISRELVKIFKNQVNFRSIQIGDQVSTIFEDYHYQSERIYTGKVLAAEFNHRDNIYQKVRFVQDKNRTMYLEPDGDLALKEVAFARYPLKGGRLSSGFGSRYHPVLRKRRMHSGIDLAAPRGTPIYATGAGRVKFVGRKGSYGKTIELSHGSGIVTRYGHMSKYKPKLGRGTKVKRGDVIGYVGSTGRSTGNHVHYEYRVHGKAVNPKTVKLPTKGVLTANEMKSFKRLAKNMSYQLIKLRETAGIDRNVRRQFGG
uniref:M23ase beta-sheet core domain-containing protein n=1 Tax=uncultured Thiotrichaceae bacterium TaxID=298394 RepID=A0A6S6UN10_9GAMM|nr:MAG: Unknown protein [uncultured Thiotrichaceae bacterium]